MKFCGELRRLLRRPSSSPVRWHKRIAEICGDDESVRIEQNSIKILAREIHWCRTSIRQLGGLW